MPEPGIHYFFINELNTPQEAVVSRGPGKAIDLCRYQSQNFFPTKQDAERAAERIKELLKGMKK